MTPEEIRAALIEQGVLKSDLDQLTDDQINQMLDEAYNQTSASGVLEQFNRKLVVCFQNKKQAGLFC